MDSAIFMASVTSADTTSITRCFIQVKADLKPFVDRIWGWESQGPAALPLVLPGTGAELVFNHRTALELENDTGGRTLLPRAFVFCARTTSHQLFSSGPVGFVSVRIRSEALRHFAKAPVSTWIDRFTPVSECLGGDYADLPDLLQGACHFQERANLVMQRLRHHLHAENRQLTSIDAMVRKLYYTSGNVRLEALAGELGIGMRQCERKFHEATGLAPKRFHRIARVHHTVRRLMLGQRHDYLDTVLEQGYYDQSHFIHECRALTGLTPGALLTRRRFMSHFYNPSLVG